MSSQSVRDFMTSVPRCCTPQDNITDVARLMLECDCGAVPVVEDQESRRLVGMITDRDIVCRIVARELDPAGTMVQQAMSGKIASVGEEATIDECIALMCEHQVRRIPVVDPNGRVTGIVSQADLAHAAEQQPELSDELTEVLEEVSEPTVASRAV